MIKRDEEYGCGFYGDEKWLDAYDALSEMFGVGKEWRARQEEKKRRAHNAAIRKQNPEEFKRLKAGGWLN